MNALALLAASGTILFWTDSPVPSLRMMRPDGTQRDAEGQAAAERLRRPARRRRRHASAHRGRHEGGELDAQWSPDGKRLTFTRMPPQDWEHSVVYTVNVDGTGLTRIGPGDSARWSPDGKKLVLSATSGANEGDLFVVNADGTGRRLMLGRPAGRRTGGRSCSRATGTAARRSSS